MSTCWWKMTTFWSKYQLFYGHINFLMENVNCLMENVNLLMETVNFFNENIDLYQKVIICVMGNDDFWWISLGTTVLGPKTMFKRCAVQFAIEGCGRKLLGCLVARSMAVWSFDYVFLYLSCFMWVFAIATIVNRCVAQFANAITNHFVPNTSKLISNLAESPDPS